MAVFQNDQKLRSALVLEEIRVRLAVDVQQLVPIELIAAFGTAAARPARGGCSRRGGR